MTKTVSFRVTSTLAAAALLIGVFAGCNADTSGLTTFSVDEVATMMAEKAVTVLDANNSDTRTKYGVVPGAVLLSSYSGFDTAAELPADKASKLVFYCSSTLCAAAPKAARLAQDAGYTDVAVMPDGIKGWVESGQPVDQAPVS